MRPRSKRSFSVEKPEPGSVYRSNPARGASRRLGGLKMVIDVNVITKKDLVLF